jgi:hypothetical protein
MYANCISRELGLDKRTYPMQCTFPYSLRYSRLILSIALGCRDTRIAPTMNGLSQGSITE